MIMSIEYLATIQPFKQIKQYANVKNFTDYLES
jgi:hypothetical protein